MEKIKGFKCFSCSQEYNVSEVTYLCKKCSGNLEVIYDYDYIKKDFGRKSLSSCNDYSIWRYFPLLPFSDMKYIPPLHIGWTPLYKMDGLASELGISELYIKDDSRNPSASLKDRAGAIALVTAREKGADIITGASTGNAGSSMACLCASAAMPAVIFVPEKAPKAKIAQLVLFGARVIMVRGTYDQAFDLCMEVSGEYGWYNRNTGYNPFTREGKKTCTLEICEQLKWKVPDKIFVSVGDGNIISGLWKGLKDLYELGFIDSLPQMIAVQSTLSSSIALSFEKSKDTDRIDIVPVSATTVADSISVDLPRDGVAAVRAIKESHGTAVTVSDEEILDTIKYMAQKTGIFGEPAGVTGFAGLRKLVREGKVSSHERIVCVVTGSGLKDIDSAMKVAGKPLLIEPALEAFKEVNKE
ncbi:MAG: threonine synthase [Candidatus Eremiobacterota bacterium]